MNSKLLADPFWTVERARKIAERRKSKTGQSLLVVSPRCSLAALCAFGFIARLFRTPSRLSRKGPSAV